MARCRVGFPDTPIQGSPVPIQAIQTLYKGFRFRSRLEARWAVFLDELKADWTYEPEGFDLEGTWYLPDFLVKDWNVWIEVKGSVPTDDEKEKCQLLAAASGKRVLLLIGEPWTESDSSSYGITLFTGDDSDWDETEGWEFGEGRRCADEIWLVSDAYGATTLKSVPHERDDGNPLSGSYAAAIVAALTTARGARFEHGESGT